MEDDEGTKDWAAREAEKHMRKEEEAASAREKDERDKRLKDELGIERFRELHAWMEGQAKSYSGQIPTKAFKVGAIKPSGGPDHHDYFEVSDPNRERFTMKISYRTPPVAPHGIEVEQHGTVPKRYFLAVGDNDSLCFETHGGQPKTIEELGSELLDSFTGP
jgi:hypothetical protein